MISESVEDLGYGGLRCQSQLGLGLSNSEASKYFKTLLCALPLQILTTYSQVHRFSFNLALTHGTKTSAESEDDAI